MEYLVDEEHRLPQMNAARVLPEVDEKEVQRRLLLDCLVIGAAFGDLAGRTRRFGIMGCSCKMENVMPCLSALTTVLADMGVEVEFGAAKAGADHAYAANPVTLQVSETRRLHVVVEKTGPPRTRPGSIKPRCARRA